MGENKGEVWGSGALRLDRAYTLNADGSKVYLSIGISGEDRTGRDLNLLGIPHGSGFKLLRRKQEPSANWPNLTPAATEDAGQVTALTENANGSITLSVKGWWPERGLGVSPAIPPVDLELVFWKVLGA